MKYNKIACVADDNEKAREALSRLRYLYDFLEPWTSPGKADIIVALGGDGFMLHTMHKYMESNVPIYGMNCGTVGFLMNPFKEDSLLERLEAAQTAFLHPLEMKVKRQDGTAHLALAINEVSLLRETAQAAKIKVAVDGDTMIEEMICDGALVATPAGSSAYNLSANGPIVPLGSGILALTPISVFRPRRWRGALLPSRVKIVFQVLEPEKRPVSAVADFLEIRDVAEVEISENRDISLQLLFDPEQTLEDRIIKEQFML